MYIPTPVIPPPSPRARELSQALSDTIRTFQRRHPDMSDLEVRQALRSAAMESGSSKSQQTLAIVLFLGVLLFSVIVMIRDS